MPFETLPLFRDDAYLRDCEATVLGINERGGIVLDRTVFYATGGGQPGDTGRLVGDGMTIPIGTTVFGESKAELVHVPAASGEVLPAPGMPLRAELDWERRHRHMRMHTALHLLCSLIPFPVTGGSIGAEESRLDFDIPEADAVDRDALTERLAALIAADHLVTTRWISDEELLANSSLVRTMSVKPPMGSGRVRLVAIGADGSIDLQPCGGTHVRSTGEIGAVAVTKIEKKGRQNRRIRLAFAGAAA
jgi:misacylated tRNA(Ala) deacylase